jgi:hypothetical protein
MSPTSPLMHLLLAHPLMHLLIAHPLTHSLARSLTHSLTICLLLLIIIGNRNFDFSAVALDLVLSSLHLPIRDLILEIMISQSITLFKIILYMCSYIFTGEINDCKSWIVVFPVIST